MKYKLMMIPLAAIALSACGGSDGGSNPGGAPYAVNRSIDLQVATTAPAATDNPDSVARAASLLIEVTDSLGDYVDDLDELFVQIAGDCRNGGSVSTSRTTVGAVTTTTLDFDECADGDEYRDGVVVLSCAVGGCAGDGSIRFGESGAAFVEQDLDGSNPQSEVLDGTIGFSGLSASRDSGILVFDLDAQFSDASGVIGAVRLNDLRMQVSDTGATDELRYDGEMRFTAFRTPSGTCDASGTVSISTAATLVYDDSRDRTESGQIDLGQVNPGSVTWSAGTVTASGGAATSSLTEREFETLCDF